VRDEHADACALLAELEELFSGRENDPVLGQKSGYDSANPGQKPQQGKRLPEMEIHFGSPIEFRDDHNLEGD
jgi:hypothetical protein